MTLPFPDVPVGLSGVVVVAPARNHNPTCPHNFTRVPPTEWTDAQSQRNLFCMGRAPRPEPEFTPDCHGCDDVHAWHQWQNTMYVTRELREIADHVFHGTADQGDSDTLLTLVEELTRKEPTMEVMSCVFED